MYLITMGAIFPPLALLEKGNKHGCETLDYLIWTSKNGLHDTISYNHNHNRLPLNFRPHPGLTGRETSPINPVIIKKTSVIKVFCILFFLFFKKITPYTALQNELHAKHRKWL